MVHCILGQALQNYPGDQLGTSINVSDLVNVNDILLMSKYYGTMQDHHATPVKPHAATVSMFSNASINFSTYPWEQRLAVLHKNDNKFKYLGAVFIANDKDTKDIRDRINFARSAFSHRQSCLGS